MSSVLGTIMRAGSLAGIAVSFISIVALAALGELTRPWPLSASGWWDGSYPAIRLVAGIGILILAATPVVVLLTFGMQSVRQRRMTTALLAGAILAILVAGLIMNLLCRVS